MDRVFAQIPLQSTSDTFKSFNTFGDLVTVIMKNAFVLASVICLILLIFGGFGVIVGAGGGDTKRMEQARQTITMAVVGLLLVVGSFWIVQIIGKLTGIDLLNPK
jgi:hypothetical protein